MSRIAAGEPRAPERKSLPRHDLILLPAIGLSTICLLAGALELTATRMFPWEGRSVTKCMVLDDPTTGLRGIPHTVCQGRLAEGRPVQ